MAGMLQQSLECECCYMLSDLVKRRLFASPPPGSAICSDFCRIFCCRLGFARFSALAGAIYPNSELYVLFRWQVASCTSFIRSSPNSSTGSLISTLFTLYYLVHLRITHWIKRLRKMPLNMHSRGIPWHWCLWRWTTVFRQPLTIGCWICSPLKFWKLTCTNNFFEVPVAQEAFQVCLYQRVFPAPGRTYFLKKEKNWEVSTSKARHSVPVQPRLVSSSPIISDMCELVQREFYRSFVWDWIPASNLKARFISRHPVLQIDTPEVKSGSLSWTTRLMTPEDAQQLQKFLQRSLLDSL